jgi:hypothetical protein
MDLPAEGLWQLLLSDDGLRDMNNLMYLQGNFPAWISFNVIYNRANMFIKPAVFRLQITPAIVLKLCPQSLSPGEITGMIDNDFEFIGSIQHIR